jgi:hypothetical protein
VREDSRRVADADRVVHGPEGSGVVRRVLYGVYVSTILAFTYGFTVVRGVLATSDADWVRRTLVSWPAAVAVLAAAVVVTVVVHGAGSRRGPVVPPLPWVDHVVTSAVDRAAAVRAWWMVSATLVVTGSTLVGAVLGGSLWASRATGPVALLVGVAGGVLLGGAIALAWLAGQVGPARVLAGRRDPRWGRPAGGLRRLTLEGLRAHAVRSSHLGGAVLSGDLRAARLEVSTPVRRARQVRLRSRGPLLTVAARDLLGMRRQPGSFVAGLLLVAPGAAGLAWGLVQPRVPVALTVIAAAVTYLGAGAWSEGTRLLGDTLGTPRLSGLDLRTEAAAHLLLPGALLLVVASGSGLAVWAAHGPSAAAGPGAVVGWLGLSVVLLLATSWVTAFRGRPGTTVFSPQGGGAGLVLWYARPLLFASLALGLPAGLAGGSGGLVVPAAWLVVLTAVAWWWGVANLTRTSTAHRE